MKSWEYLATKVEDGIGWITLNRPEARNPLSRGMSREIVEAMSIHLSDPNVRCLAITGAGEAFCAGADLSQLQQVSDMSTADAYHWPEAIVESHRLSLTAGKPLIAAVNGPAYAGGMGLAGMCDIIIALRSATFAMPEVKIGLFPMIIVAHLSRALPRKKLQEMMLTGEPITAEEGYRLGFVNRLVDTPEQLVEAVREYGAKFARTSPQALRMGRRATQILADLPADAALQAAQYFNVPFFLGDDFQEGAKAFLEKRRPKWVTD